jgi:hypothetical protein
MGAGEQTGTCLVALGLLLHGVWDAWHHRRNRVVTRSFAEWCGVFDILLAVVVVIAVAVS